MGWALTPGVDRSLTRWLLDFAHLSNLMLMRMAIGQHCMRAHIRTLDAIRAGSGACWQPGSWVARAEKTTSLLRTPGSVRGIRRAPSLLQQQDDHRGDDQHCAQQAEAVGIARHRRLGPERVAHGDDGLVHGGCSVVRASAVSTVEAAFNPRATAASCQRHSSLCSSQTSENFQLTPPGGQVTTACTMPGMRSTEPEISWHRGDNQQ